MRVEPAAHSPTQDGSTSHLFVAQFGTASACGQTRALPGGIQADLDLFDGARSATPCLCCMLAVANQKQRSGGKRHRKFALLDPFPEPSCRRLSSVSGGVLKGCDAETESGSAEAEVPREGVSQRPLRHSLDFSPASESSCNHTHGPRTQHNWRDWTIHPDGDVHLPGRPFRSLTSEFS